MISEDTKVASLKIKTFLDVKSSTYKKHYKRKNLAKKGGDNVILEKGSRITKQHYIAMLSVCVFLHVSALANFELHKT